MRGRLAAVLSLLFLSTCFLEPPKNTFERTRNTYVDSSCIYPEGFGAVVDDGVDDRAQVQAAIDDAVKRGTCVHLSKGTYHISHIPVVGAANASSLRVTGDVTILGVGRGQTKLAMLGSAVVPGRTAPSDWWLIGVFAPLRLSNLTLDGSARTGTGEQTHLLQIGEGAHDVVVENVDFNLPSLAAGSSGGDCVRVVGSSAKWVSRVTIRDSVGLSCDRSFIAVQRGVEDLTVERSESINVGDQAVDMEPTGGSGFMGPCVRRVVLRDSVFRRGPRAQGAFTVAIGGDGPAIAHDVKLVNSVVEDGGVYIIDASDVTLQGLHLVNQLGRGEPTILARKRVIGLRVYDSIVERLVGSVVGPVVKVHEQNGQRPTDVTMSNVTVRSAVPGGLVYAESLASLVVVGSRFEYTGPPTDGYAIKNRGVSFQAGAPVLADTVVSGQLGGLVQLVGLTDGTRPSVVRTTWVH